MGKIYKNQTELRLKLTTNVDISGASVKKIKYKKPSGAIGYWDANAATTLTGVLYYDVAASNVINEAGTWRLWAYVTFSTGDSAPGEGVSVKVYEESD